jgi:dihydroxycyclohexadiene carboxylate dehydrogenase
MQRELVAEVHPPDFSQHFHADHLVFSCSKSEQKQLNTWVSFQSAEQPLMGQFSVSGNTTALGGTEAPPRRIPRNSEPQSDLERGWYQQIVDQTIDNTLMKRYGTIDEQAGAILFLASDDAAYIIGVTLPVSGGDVGVIYVAATAKARTRP